ncbi:MAG TPA: mechanosensitive ion channel family protein [Silvibacterium sp.]|nr:mechanosensitive ion channel family protein [Silvibacterium sp.]
MHISWIELRQFFASLDTEWLSDLREFLRRALPRILVILFLAWLLTRSLKVITRRVIATAERRSRGGRQLAQVRTLTSVIRGVIIGIVGFLAALEILPLLGFNLQPLLASAGVAGLAFGFAAQTILRDWLNGIFILMEGQYNIGDVVVLAGVRGTVEAMTLRETTLRDLDGTLYIIPNSQITTVANVTRDYSLVSINVAVDYSAEPDKVVSLLKEVTMSVRTDPAYADVFLADPMLLGVDSIRGSQVIYLVRIRTKPNQQWDALRETQRRIRIALAENNMLPGDPLRVFNTGSETGQMTHPSLLAAARASDPTLAEPD